MIHSIGGMARTWVGAATDVLEIQPACRDHWRVDFEHDTAFVVLPTILTDGASVGIPVESGMADFVMADITIRS